MSSPKLGCLAALSTAAAAALVVCGLAGCEAGKRPDGPEPGTGAATGAGTADAGTADVKTPARVAPPKPVKPPPASKTETKPDYKALAKEVLAATAVKGGLVVHLGCDDGKLTAALRANGRYVARRSGSSSGPDERIVPFLVQGLGTDSGAVAKARRHIASLGAYGNVTVDRIDGRRLPYVDGLVNLLVVTDRYRVSTDEMLRVLAPLGEVHVREAGKWKKTVKPWPEGIDEWTHYLHGPDNNAVAQDTVVGPPRHMQWLGSPLWTRSHHKLCSISSVVTARGRLFYILDEATSANMGVPGKWCIVARNAFSGVTLWKKRMESWTSYRQRFRSGPPQVARLLVASGDRVYAPLGLNAPVSEMDAATGETLRTYEETDGAEEIVLAPPNDLPQSTQRKARGEGSVFSVPSVAVPSLGTLLVLKGSPAAEHAAGHPAFKGKAKLPNRKTLVALDARTGRKRWEWSDPSPWADPMPETLASHGTRVYFQAGESVTCLDLASGKELWTHGERGKKRRGGRVTYGKHVLVAADGVVLCKLAGNLTALDAGDGRKLWECKAGGGFHAPLDVFVIDGVVWQGLHTSDSVAPPPVRDFNECRDLRTGEVKGTNTVMVDLQTSGHHHRCYREKATVRYIITGKRGIEMMDLTGSDHSRNNWVRGACQYGVLPANGLMYAPPHSCGCYMESLLTGFWALAAERPVVSESRYDVPDTQRLEKGPAYGALGKEARAPSGLRQDDAESWPLYRHDALRSGVAGTVVPAKLEQAWKADVGGRPTQPVVAGGKVVLSAVDECTVHALDEKTGKPAWKRVVGGRVDSPPAIHNGMVLFGSADGRVHCLRLSDGEVVWRFLAAPADLRAVAFDRVESLWPVHGSVMVLKGVAYFSAGRSTWLDGGITLYGLDPASGKVVHRTRYASRHPKLGEGKDRAKKEHVKRVSQNTTDYKTFLAPDRSDSFSMAGGTITDVLVSDGRDVFLHQVRFDSSLRRQEAMSRHLFSTSSLLDGAENHRSHWVLGTGDFSLVPVAYSWIVNRPGKRNPTIAVPTGVMMVYDEGAIWGVQRKGDANGRYHLFKKDNRPFSEDEKPLPDFRKIPKEEVNRCVWRSDIPVRARAMLKSGENLFMGVMPVAVPEGDPHAAYEGRKGGAIWVVSAADGSRIAEYRIDSPVVWDGMAAANGRLFVSTAKGELQCWRGRAASGAAGEAARRGRP